MNEAECKAEFRVEKLENSCKLFEVLQQSSAHKAKDNLLGTKRTMHPFKSSRLPMLIFEYDSSIWQAGPQLSIIANTLIDFLYENYRSK